MMPPRRTTMRRRTFLNGFAATVTAAAAGPLIVTDRTLAQTRTIFVNTWGGSWTAAEEAAFFKPFTEATGIRVRTVAPVSYAKLKAQVQSGSYEWDVTAITQADLLRADREGLVEPIDWSIVKKDKLFPNAVYANGLAYCALGTNLAYRRDKFPQGGPKTWADFWDVKKFPGNRSMLNNAIRAAQFALVADGVAPDKVFPLDVDRAFKKLDQIKPHIKVWWTQGNQSQQLLRDGEVDMMVMWNARASELAQQPHPGRAPMEPGHLAAARPTKSRPDAPLRAAHRARPRHQRHRPARVPRALPAHLHGPALYARDTQHVRDLARRHRALPRARLSG